ncbi:hypothetical protein UA75_31335 (plasmid) [Actinoalloteichus sp. GBA129-24]|nr:hypothetical protein UA75_14855 [Actinoalloteichus sp. GBA129-24]APU24230.1 hypothetical protein UA75_31335 [Actinoalloteichus sp. GBA129-24]
MGLFRRRRRESKRRSLRQWASDQGALTVAILLSGGSSAVDLAAQISYYLSLPLEFRIPVVDLMIDLAYPIAAVVVGVGWVFGVFAAWCSRRGLPSGKHIARMWLFSGIAAVINTVHGADLSNDLMTGLVLGGVSLLAPITWHSYVTLAREQRAGFDLADLREKAMQRIMHPVIYYRAARLRTLDPSWGSERAWEMASVAARLDAEADYQEDLDTPRGSDRKQDKETRSPGKPRVDRENPEPRPAETVPVAVRPEVRPDPSPRLGVSDFAAVLGLSLSDRDEAVDRSARPDRPTEPTSAVPPRPTPSPVRIAAARQSLDELIEQLEQHANGVVPDGQRITEDWVQDTLREMRGSGVKAERARKVRDELNARRAA